MMPRLNGSQHLETTLALTLPQGLLVSPPALKPYERKVSKLAGDMNTGTL